MKVSQAAIQIPASSIDINGFAYEYNVVVQALEQDKMTVDPINQKDISVIQFSNKLNQLYMDGILEFTDTTGHFDKYMYLQYSFVNINIKEFTKIESGNIKMGQLRSEFNHDFLIDRIQILERNESNIRYRFYLVTSKILNLIRKIEFSSYGKKMDVTDHLKTFLVDFDELEIGKTINENKDGMIIEYITNGNDDFFSLFRFLMNRLYYSGNRFLGQLRYLYLDINTNKYEWFIPDKTSSRFRSILIGAQEKGLDRMMLGDNGEVRLGSVINKPKVQTIKSIYEQRMTTYDIASNSFSEDVLPSKTLVNMYGTDNQSKQGVVQNLMFDKNYVNNVSQWDNDNANYFDFVSNQIDQNSVIFETSGQLDSLPSDTVCVKIMDKANEEHSNIKYGEIEGIWFISKTTQIFRPNDDQPQFKSQFSMIKQNRSLNHEKIGTTHPMS